jgi:hypothetical protein
MTQTIREGKGKCTQQVTAWCVGVRSLELTVWHILWLPEHHLLLSLSYDLMEALESNIPGLFPVLDVIFLCMTQSLNFVTYSPAIHQ